MIRLHVKSVSVVFVLLFMLAILQSSPIEAASQKIKFAFELPASHPWGQGAQAFKEYVEEKTQKGTLVELYPAGQLGGSSEDIQQGVMLGTIDIGISSTPIVLLNPLQKLFDLPFLFSTREEAWAVLDGPIGSKVGKNLEEKGLKALSYWEDGFRQVTNSVRPIKTAKDFEGLKIRTPYSPQRLATFKQLGAKPTSMPFSEVFSALEQGVIDGQENPLTVIWNSSFYDVQKYLTITNHVYSPATLLINLNAWEKLSTEQQEIILEAAVIGQKVNRDLNAEGDESLVAKLEEKGMQVDTLPKEEISKIKELVRPVWDMFVEEEGEEAAKLIEETQEFIEQM